MEITLFTNLRFHLICLLPMLASVPANASSAPSSPDGNAPTLSIESIAFKLRDGSTIAAERGSFKVPERRRKAGSRHITISFVRFKSTNPHPGAPIVYLAGGPGGSGIDAAKGPRQPIFLALRAVADVIALDQRGTGLSNAIPPCTAIAPFDPADGITETNLTGYYRRTLSTCITKWRAAGVTVEGYNTLENADDVNDLRKALGAPKLQLWGISYGAHLALATMRRHPATIERAVLASAEGMDQTVKLPAAIDAALGRIAAVADRTGGGDLLATIRRVHARLDAKPVVLTVGDVSGSLAFTMDSFALRMLAGGIAKNPRGIGNLQGIYAAFDAGQENAFAPMLYGMLLKDPLVMTGMPELMDLASGITASRRAIVERQARIALTGQATNFPMPQIERSEPGLDLGDNFRREVRSAIPTLLFSGDLDVRTPLEEQTAATAGLQRLTRIIVRNGGHDLFEADPRISSIIVAFFGGKTVDTAPLTVALPMPDQAG
jgi:pimeloyl-ACP methyl ester carboxylesterase